MLLNTPTINEVLDIVKPEYGDHYKIHIAVVLKYNTKLATINNLDVESAQLAALLHDIGRMRYGGDNHDQTGANDARKILTSLKLNFQTRIRLTHHY